MSGDFYKEWRAKAEVDCFPQLVTLNSRGRFYLIDTIR